MSMTKETLFKIVEDAKMEPLIDEEVSGKQFGWRKMTTERLPQLEALNGPEVKVEVHQIAHTYLLEYEENQQTRVLKDRYFEV